MNESSREGIFKEWKNTQMQQGNKILFGKMA